MNSAAANVDWNALSPRGWWILWQIALPVALGFSYAEAGARLGQSRWWISRGLDELASEIASQRAVTVNPTPGRVSYSERRCRGCGDPLPADATARRQYCDDICRVSAWKERR